MNYIIFSYLLIGLHIQIIKSNEIFPTIPGSETGITPIHSTGYFIQFSQKNKNMKDMFSNTISVTSNYTFHINTTNMNKKCTPECYINCQVQFEYFIKQHSSPRYQCRGGSNQCQRPDPLAGRRANKIQEANRER